MNVRPRWWLSRTFAPGCLTQMRVPCSHTIQPVQHFSPQRCHPLNGRSKCPVPHNAKCIGKKTRTFAYCEATEHAVATAQMHKSTGVSKHHTSTHVLDHVFVIHLPSAVSLMQASYAAPPSSSLPNDGTASRHNAVNIPYTTGPNAPAP